MDEFVLINAKEYRKCLDLAEEKQFIINVKDISNIKFDKYNDTGIIYQMTIQFIKKDLILVVLDKDYIKAILIAMGMDLSKFNF